MKTKIDAVIVVEGKSDIQFLETFIDAILVSTNGSDVPRETIDYLLNLSHTKDIIVLTDPDSPGKRIRDILDANIPNLKHAYVEKSKSIKKHKVGVAESSKEHVLESLQHLIYSKDMKLGDISMEQLYQLGLTGQSNSAELRQKVMQELHLGFGNAKTMLKRINQLNTTFEELEKTVRKVQ